MKNRTISSQDCAFFEIFFVTLQYGKRYNL
nr:MAG TPA: hypothetical protein [Caudoviricetes sp.]DAG55123.1 MAG TPA: hypothetical protein [Caudoviricetes sp.]DAH60357.1 MAG TPA: hypothetical protein [Caudoviricetes sp.]DAQ65932.1 MAG TPA: hypothetical protein [Bacteriophage sp.]